MAVNFNEEFMNTLNNLKTGEEYAGNADPAADTDAAELALHISALKLDTLLFPDHHDLDGLSYHSYIQSLIEMIKNPPGLYQDRLFKQVASMTNENWKRLQEEKYQKDAEEEALREKEEAEREAEVAARNAAKEKAKAEKRAAEEKLLEEKRKELEKVRTELEAVKAKAAEEGTAFSAKKKHIGIICVAVFVVCIVLAIVTGYGGILGALAVIVPLILFSVTLKKGKDEEKKRKDQINALDEKYREIYARLPGGPVSYDGPVTYPSAEAASGSGGINVTTPVDGKVFRITVNVGDKVAADDEIILLDVMNMTIPVTAPAAGTVSSIRVLAGEAVMCGETIAVIS